MVVTSRLRGLFTAWLLGSIGLCFATASAAQEVSATTGPVSALEFRLDGDFTLAPLQGTSLSWKHYDDGDRGWRLGLTPYYGSEIFEESDPSYQESRQYGLTVECQRLGFMASRSAARPYWGLGVLVGAGRREAEYHREPAAGIVVHREQTETTYRAGIVGSLGAEFTIAGKLVIGAEYSIAATWSRDRAIDRVQDDLSEDDLDRRSTRITYGLNDRPVALTIAILF